MDGLNKTTSLLDITFDSLVLGFLPILDFFCLIENVPNFDNFNFFSDLIFLIIVDNIKNEKKLKLSKFGTFTIRQKKSRVGRNPKTKEIKIISSRDVVLFRPSIEFKDFFNLKDYG